MIKHEYIDYKYKINPKTNILEYLLEKYPDKDWNICGILKNPNTPEWYIHKYFDTHIEEDCFCVSINPHLTIDIIKRHDPKLFSWFHLSKHFNITLEIIELHPELPWNYTGISLNPNLTIEFYRKYKDKEWSFHYISSNEAMTPEIIKNNPDFEWNFRGLSVNRSITEEFVLENKDKDWEMIYLSGNDAISGEFFERYIPEFTEYIAWLLGIPANINTDMKFIERHIDKDISFEHISRHPKITIEFIEKYPDKLWNWFQLSRNQRITQKDVDEHPDWPWDLNGLSENPNIDLNKIKFNIQYVSVNAGLTLEFIERHIEQINFDELSSNWFLYKDSVYNKHITQDITNRKESISKYLNTQTYNDIVSIILLYIGYD